MEELRQPPANTPESTEPMTVDTASLGAGLPETLAEAERLAASIERAVLRETSGGVRDLSVEVHPEGVMLKGYCETFYCKQLAQHAAMGVPGGDRLTNDIEVS